MILKRRKGNSAFKDAVLNTVDLVMLPTKIAEQIIRKRNFDRETKKYNENKKALTYKKFKEKKLRSINENLEYIEQERKRRKQIKIKRKFDGIRRAKFLKDIELFKNIIVSPESIVVALHNKAGTNDFRVTAIYNSHKLLIKFNPEKQWDETCFSQYGSYTRNKHEPAKITLQIESFNSEVELTDKSHYLNKDIENHLFKILANELEKKRDEMHRYFENNASENT